MLFKFSLNGHYTHTHIKKQKSSTFKDKNMNPFSFFFLKHQFKLLLFFKLGTRYSTVNIFFFLQYLFWLLTSKDVDTDSPSMWEPEGQIVFKPHTQNSYSYLLLASIRPNPFRDIKGRTFPPRFLSSWSLNLLLWPRHQSFPRSYLDT